ncbi:MAG: VCBS repeat-containing protein, partial [Elusimicrobia bacterium]|nr:VCBS repeat-containing protein [Elusimicrobiota bacterium]
LLVLSNSGVLISQWTVPEGGGPWTPQGGGALVLGNLDDDPDLEIIRSGFTKVHAYNRDGTPVPGWPTSENWADGSAVVLGDIDGDGRPEILTFQADTLSAWNRQGQMLPGWPVTFPGFEVGMNVSLGDITGDGVSEVLVYPFQKYYWSFHALNAAGSEIAGFPISGTLGLPYESIGGPLLTDLEGDGKLDIVLYEESESPVGTMRLLALDWQTPFSAVNNPWPMYGKDAGHTHCLNTVPPEVSMTSPGEGLTLLAGQSLLLSAEALDDVKVAGVRFQWDGQNTGSEILSSPYQLLWKVPLAEGVHTLSAEARDMEGNVSRSSAIHVTVKRPDPRTPPKPGLIGVADASGQISFSLQEKGGPRALLLHPGAGVQGLVFGSEVVKASLLSLSGNVISEAEGPAGSLTLALSKGGGQFSCESGLLMIQMHTQTPTGESKVILKPIVCAK